MLGSNPYSVLVDSGYSGNIHGMYNAVHQPVIAVKLDDPKLRPLRANPTDAGADLFSKDTLIIYPGRMEMVDTGVSVRVPEGYVGLVYSRSGQGKIRVSLTNSVGVIDADYRGNIKVMLLNEGDDPYEIHAGITRIAQLVVAPVLLPMFVDYIGDNWSDTTRGTNGFGSTDKRNING